MSLAEPQTARSLVKPPIRARASRSNRSESKFHNGTLHVRLAVHHIPDPFIPEWDHIPCSSRAARAAS